MKILVIGAHPDDCEIKCGGTAILLTRAGHQVRFVSVTNGEKGHHRESGQPLINRRLKEAQAAAMVAGTESLVLDNPDGELEPDLPTRWHMLTLIREFAPDVIITHRLADYHPDHRATSQLVQDCSYLVRVPLVCPEAPIPAQMPVILLMSDSFSQPQPFAPQIAVGIDALYGDKVRMLHCHESQVYEWLPWIDGQGDVPTDELQRLEWLTHWLSARDRAVARQSREALAAHYGPDMGAGVACAEAFEISEYGRQIGAEELLRAWEI